MIDIDNLRLRIQGREILKGVDLHLRPGDIYGLLGPNGAGKTTTVFALLGLYAHQDGRLNVMGADPREDAVTIRRSVGVMPEKAGFYPWMTAHDYLKWYGRLFGLESTDRDLGALLEKVGLDNDGGRRVGTYSRGMKQRLAVARAMITHPRLLILDEPTNGLDPTGRREIHDLLLGFVAENDTGVLLCTHRLDDVDRLCNRIGIIDDGRTRLEGGLGELLANQQGSQRYRLRLHNGLTSGDWPEDVVVLGEDGEWVHVQVNVTPSEGPSALWGELWRRGWKIHEIRSEASSLEELYIGHTGRPRKPAREAA